jgi:hypothetical protein
MTNAATGFFSCTVHRPFSNIELVEANYPKIISFAIFIHIAWTSATWTSLAASCDAFLRRFLPHCHPLLHASDLRHAEVAPHKVFSL